MEGLDTVDASLTDLSRLVGSVCQDIDSQMVSTVVEDPVMPTKQPSGMASVMSRTTGSTPSRYRKLNSCGAARGDSRARGRGA